MRRLPYAYQLVEPEPGRAVLTVGEASFVLHVSTRTLRELVANGSLRSIKIGGRRLIPREAVAEFIAQGGGAAVVR